MHTDIRCAACAAARAGELKPGEDLYQAKNRLRAELGQVCRRAVPCPMRGERSRGAAMLRLAGAPG